MSLVEVTVSMGIASVLLTGILTLVNYSNKTVKNVSTTSDWNMFVAEVQQTFISDPDACSGMLAATLANRLTGAPIGNPAGIGTINVGSASSPPQIHATASPKNVLTLTRLNAAGTAIGGSQRIADASAAGGNYGAFTLKQFEFHPDPKRWVAPLPTVTIATGSPPVPTTYEVRPLLLFLQGEKPRIGGPTGESVVLGSPTVRNKIGIPITVLFGAGNQVYSCYGSEASAAKACEDLGGQYLPSPVGPASGPEAPYRCRIRPIRFMGSPGTAATPVGNLAAGNLDGMALQLWTANPALPRSAEDYAIGVDPSTLWFNAGGDASSKFQWHYRSTIGGAFNYDTLKLRNRDGWGTGQGVVDLNVGDPGGASPISSITLGNGSTDRIISHRTAPPTPDAPGWDIEFQTQGASRFAIRNDGKAVVYASTSGVVPTAVAGIYLGDPSVPNPSGGAAAQITSIKAGLSLGFKDGIELMANHAFLGLSEVNTLVFANTHPGASLAKFCFGLDALCPSGLGGPTVNSAADPFLKLYSGEPGVPALNMHRFRNSVSFLNTLRGELAVEGGSLTLGVTPTDPAPLPVYKAGNVPYGCRLVEVSRAGGSGPGALLARCAAGEIAVGGGGSCAVTGATISVSEPHAPGPGPLIVDATQKFGWRFSCDYSSAGPPPYPQEHASAICCKM